MVRLGGPELLRHVVRSPDVYLVPRRGGELLLGATMEEQGLDALPTAGAVLDLLREAWRILPGLYDLAVTELSVGFRPAVRDHRPVIGAATTRGLYVATGHFRNGVLLAPATAHYLAGWIAEGGRRRPSRRSASSGWRRQPSRRRRWPAGERSGHVVGDDRVG